VVVSSGTTEPSATFDWLEAFGQTLIG
jgi:hypothetical protein